VLVADEIAKDFVLKPGDTLPLTVYPDDQERSRPVKFTVAGSFRSFPPTFPASELVINQAAFPAFLLGQPDFYLARVVSGTGADQVAAELRRAGIERGFAVTTQADQRRFGQPNLAALNLGPLSDIESVAAALIAAIGVAVLGAFIVLERRREFAILRAVGADTAQVVSGPAQEGLVTVIGSIVIGIVVGGGSGIGRATAELFAAQGAGVAVADINKDGVAETAEMLRSSGAQVSEHICDITNPDQTDLLVSEVIEAHGRLDIVTSTVGWSDTTFFAQEDEVYWRKIIDINLMGSIFLCRSALRVLSEQKSGTIVLTSSDAGKVGTMGETVYAAAKAGVIGFVKSLAREIARDGIRINAISPGPTDTPLLRAQSDQHVIEKMIKAVPLKRMGTPIEQAAPIVFLASDAASFITGQTLSVSGGLTMTS